MQAASSKDALDRAAKAHGGRVPDHIYLCAGFSKPKLMLDSSEDEFQGVRRAHAYRDRGMVLNAVGVRRNVLGISLERKSEHSTFCLSRVGWS